MDDITVFTRASQEGLLSIKEFLDRYQSYSGQQVNASEAVAFEHKDAINGGKVDLIVVCANFHADIHFTNVESAKSGIE